MLKDMARLGLEIPGEARVAALGGRILETAAGDGRDLSRDAGVECALSQMPWALDCMAGDAARLEAGPGRMPDKPAAPLCGCGSMVDTSA